MSNNSVLNNSVIYIEDPNTYNIDKSQINGISQYQDMNIYAELVAERKGRSVLEKGSIITDDKVSVSFVGYNQNVNNSNVMNFTSNYYDGSSGLNNIQYESFGITNIKVTINSSYVPQVSISFVDIRGLSFFNQTNSPYRMLFDFPPPTFTLTIKGYYGRSLKYDLHLVKYNTEFKSENGNYVIDADFIAMTFAPLSDTLFRYAINGALINSRSISQLSSNPKEPPKNTNDLILKLKNFYTPTKEMVDSLDETKQYNQKISDNVLIDSAINLLNDFKNDEILISSGTPFVFTSIKPETSIDNGLNVFKLLNSVYEYDKLLQEDWNKGTTNITNRIYIGYFSDINNPKNKQYELALGKFIDKINGIVKQLNLNITSNKPALITLNDNRPPALQYLEVSYYCVDITDYYGELNRKRIDNKFEIDKLSVRINDKVITAIEDRLGMIPTIYKVFELILNDVDTFFNILRKTSEESERHHGEYINEIRNVLGDTDGNTANKIYSFPLIVTEDGSRKERVAPISISNRLPVQFPELDMIYNFINTFALQGEIQEIYNMKEQVNSDGSNKWIPISTLDSKLHLSNLQSPYLTIGLSDVEEENKLTGHIFNSLLNRFYILTQYVIPNKFFDTKLSNSYSQLFGESEAINIISTIKDSTTASLLERIGRLYKTNINQFFLDVNKLGVSNYSNLKNVDVIDDIYINKLSDNYIGVEIYYDNIDLRQDIDDNTPLGIFAKSIQNKKWGNILSPKLIEESFKFSNENIVTIIDSDGNDINEDSINIKTRYLSDNNRFNFVNSNNRNDRYVNVSDITTGNNYFGDLNKWQSSSNSNLFTNSVDVISSSLAYNGRSLYNQLINGDNLSAMLILSYFGNLLSPFNVYPNKLSENIFQMPSIVEIPNLMPAYIGGVLVNSVTDEWNDIILPFYDLNSQNKSVYLRADRYDFENYLSVHDKEVFINAYNSFINDNLSDNGFYSLRTKFLNLIVDNNYTSDKEVYYKSFKKNNSLIITLMSRIHLLISDENAFSFRKNQNLEYVPLSKIRLNSLMNKDNKDGVILNFFKYFFSKLEELASDIMNDVKQNEIKNLKLRYDADIINEMYYSFKRINDKWIGNSKTNKGYPFNGTSGRLIDLFSFVDRAMNPIGDTIINPEILLDLFNDPNVSVLSVLSQLLSMNHFEFFPLQNFMLHDRESLKDSFSIYPTISMPTESAFICMYIGGSSSYPSNISGNGYENDGIDNISTTNLPDFGGILTLDYDNNNPNVSYYKKVHAFRVLFGQQNQSMFKDIKIDGKEYPETNESIQIMSRLAGDEQLNAPTPKGQNLYSVYENRAYSATITGLGNAMIQPTQYFQLDNVPLFNGAYLILSVEHDITPNKMTTSFTGTKILKYPIPRVLNPAVAFGLGFQNTSGNVITSKNMKNFKINVDYNKVGIIKEILERNNITNKYTIASIIGVAYKESGLVPKTELSYRKTDNGRIRSIFGCRVNELSDSELNELKINDIGFFDRVYGVDVPATCKFNVYGNTVIGDGFKYRGRGLNQLTFKDSYANYGKLINVDLVMNPDKLNEFDVAAKVLVKYFEQSFNKNKRIMLDRYGVSNINDFDNLQTAYEAMYNINAGLGKDTRNSYNDGKGKGNVATNEIYSKIA